MGNCPKKPDPNIAFILAFFLPGVDRMYIGHPGRGVLKLITFVTAPALGVFLALTGSVVAGIQDLTTGGTLGTMGIAALVGLSGVIWWLADLFVIRDEACAMRLVPYCEDIQLPDLLSD